MTISLTHKKPTGVTPNVFDYLEPLLCPNCVMVLDYMIQEQKFRDNIYRAMCSNPKYRIKRAVLAETCNDSIIVVVAIPAVIFFPGETPISLMTRLRKNVRMKVSRMLRWWLLVW